MAVTVCRPHLPARFTGTQKHRTHFCIRRSAVFLSSVDILIVMSGTDSSPAGSAPRWGMEPGTDFSMRERKNRLLSSNLSRLFWHSISISATPSRNVFDYFQLVIFTVLLYRFLPAIPPRHSAFQNLLNKKSQAPLQLWNWAQALRLLSDFARNVLLHENKKER